MTYDVDHFISKFEKTKEEEWWTEDFTDGSGRYCALGHCGQTNLQDTEEGEALNDILSYQADEINDGLDPRYPQPTPRQRILAALRDIKEKKA